MADDETLHAITDGLMGDIPPRDGAYIKTQIATADREELQSIVEEIPASQSKLSIGLKCGVVPVGEEYYALLLGNCLFGGSPFSKLFMNVREKLSLAYYAASRTDRMKSVMVISSGIETKNFQKAYDEIQLQLAKMQAGEIEESELAAAKKYLANGLTAMYDSVRALEDYYLSQAIMGQNQSPEELIQALDGVGISEIQAVMQKIQLDTVYFLKGVEA
jgi:predicted Zn-dependent peptidase